MYIKVQCCGRAKRVCWTWNEAFSVQNQHVFEKLLPYQPLFTPMFKRFVMLVSEIDTTMGSRSKEKPYMRATIWEPISQYEYEYEMLRKASARAQGQGNLDRTENFALNNFLQSSSDKNLFFISANILAVNYYGFNVVKKMDIALHPERMPKDESGFATKTIGELLENIESIHIKDSNNVTVGNAYRILKDLIEKYRFLPIDQGNPALAVVKVSREFTRGDYIFWIIVAITAIMMGLQISN